MSMAGSFLGGAKSRLLPASVPFSFFLGASGFHVLAWAALFAGAADIPGYSGGPGPVLAAIHLLTLGVLALTAMGASYQLLPVVTRQPIGRVWQTYLSLWLMVPGIILLAWGMGVANTFTMGIGGGLSAAGLILFAGLTAQNLARAGSLPVVAAHGAGAMVALLGLIAIGLALIGDFDLGYLNDHSGLATIHMILGVFGFMGLLVLGLSLVLIPMFVLSRSPPSPLGWAQLGLATVAIMFFLSGILSGHPTLSIVAFAPGLASVGAYFWLMRVTQKASMRKRLGLSFLMIRLSWGLLGLSLLIGLATSLGLPVPNGATLFGFLVLAGWLLTFLTGILQRIMPFLASMHASGQSGVPMLLSGLTAETPLRVHVFCHLSALLLISFGILFDLVIAIQVGAAIGLVGSLGFAGFAINVVIRLRVPKNPA